MMKQILGTFGVIFGLLLLVGEAAKHEATGSGQVTARHYSEVRHGMSYYSVVEVIGREGHEMARNKLDGAPGIFDSIETVMYVWQNPDGSNMNVMLQNDRVIQKAQWGLR